MSAKFKFFLIVVFSIFATAATGMYISVHQLSTVSSISNGQVQQSAAATQAKVIVENPERTNYKSIPLDSINSTLQGSDPADLALNAFEDMESKRIPRKVEVFYPEPNQAMVTITQKNQAKDSVGAIKYRVELTTFGRSLLVSSPRVWQIVWAGVKSEE
ncbi:MAG: hypothetical protein DSM106950_09440 [Stigonema ocellatum SAG 48.90 = DSM 106950]|nr:hypothetical protein [Stigonema ocellatum SAG 48.90 = DSM 106950]